MMVVRFELQHVLLLYYGALAPHVYTCPYWHVVLHQVWCTLVLLNVKERKAITTTCCRILLFPHLLMWTIYMSSNMVSILVWSTLYQHVTPVHMNWEGLGGSMVEWIKKCSGLLEPWSSSQMPTSRSKILLKLDWIFSPWCLVLLC